MKFLKILYVKIRGKIIVNDIIIFVIYVGTIYGVCKIAIYCNIQDKFPFNNSAFIYGFFGIVVFAFIGTLCHRDDKSDALILFELMLLFLGLWLILTMISMTFGFYKLDILVTFEDHIKRAFKSIAPPFLGYIFIRFRGRSN